jgi:hypothetical protein
MLWRSRLLISGSIRSVVVLAALGCACPVRAQQAALFEVVKPPTLERIVAENRQEYRALLRTELQFCRNACDLTDNQCQQIARRAGPIVEGAADWAAKLELKPAQRGGIWLNTDPAPPNAIKLTRDILLKIMKEHTTLAQQIRYRAELAKRLAHQRLAARDMLIARIDRILILSSDQRAKLSRVLDANWDDEWGAIVNIQHDDGSPFPVIPYRLILPILHPNQQRVWKRCDQQAVDATDYYKAAVLGYAEDLPSDLEPWLKADGPAPVVQPIGREAPEKREERSNRPPQ